MTSPPRRLTDALTAPRDRFAATPLGLATPERDTARRAAVDAVAEDGLIGPMTAVREDADRFRAAVEAARR